MPKLGLGRGLKLAGGVPVSADPGRPFDDTDMDTEVLTLSDASVSAFAKAANAPLNFFRKSRRRGNTILGRAGREPSVVVSSVES